MIWITKIFSICIFWKHLFQPGVFIYDFPTLLLCIWYLNEVKIDDYPKCIMVRPRGWAVQRLHVKLRLNNKAVFHCISSETLRYVFYSVGFVSFVTGFENTCTCKCYAKRFINKWDITCWLEHRIRTGLAHYYPLTCEKQLSSSPV